MVPDVRLRVTEPSPVRLRVTEQLVERHGALPWYEGPYQVTPDVEEQTLETADMAMRDDVTVHEIPYAVASNEAGGLTVSIAS